MFGLTMTIEDLAKKEIALDDRRRTKAAELAMAERTAGDAYLADESAGVAESVMWLRAEVDVIGRAIESIHAKRADVILAGFRDRAKAIRSELAKKHGELSALNEKTAKHLAAISDLQGVEYPIALLSANGALGLWGNNPRSVQLEREVAELEHQAITLESAAVPDSGRFEYSDRDNPLSDDGVVLGVLEQPTNGPCATEIRAWLAKIALQVQGRGHHVSPSELELLPRDFFVVWANGLIDESVSRVYIPSMSPRMPSYLGFGEGGYDTAKGTFTSVVQ